MLIGFFKYSSCFPNKKQLFFKRLNQKNFRAIHYVRTARIFINPFFRKSYFRSILMYINMFYTIMNSPTDYNNVHRNIVPSLCLINCVNNFYPKKLYVKL